MKIKNEKGEEIEVFTSEEVSVKISEAAATAKTEAVEEFKAANPDKSAELDKAKEDLAKTQQDLDDAIKGGGNKEQIERLRKERDDAKKLADEATKGFESKLDAFRKEIIGDIKKESLDKLAGNDVELRKKIEFEFDSYRPNDTTKAGIQQRMLKAYQLATDKPAPQVFDGGFGANERGTRNPVSMDGSGQLTPNQSAIGRVLGVTEKDRENYKVFQKDQDAKRAAGLIPPKN